VGWNPLRRLRRADPFVIGGAPAGVPEPVTWAMMIMGLGAVGMTLRARRRPVLATEATTSPD